MQRRHFIKLSATGTAGILFGRISHALGNNLFAVNTPLEVWAQLNNMWVKLTPSNGIYGYKDVHVYLKHKGEALSVTVQCPTEPLNAIRLRWQHNIGKQTLILGDHWERSYGDIGWKKPQDSVKNPWYVIMHDGKQSSCLGVKTGCNSICWWRVDTDFLELTLDTNSGGTGVHLGERTLHAADIITTQSLNAETPFATTHRFCKMMCDKPRLPKQPVYGINDWYFAYGNNSAKLIKDTTAIMSALATDQSNRPFSVVDAGWAAYSPLLPNDCCWQEDFSRPNEKFKDMHQLASDIKELGMRPGLWTRPLCAKHDDSASLLLPVIPGRDNPKNPILDPTIDENLERIKTNVTTYQNWGYELVKHDFTTFDITGRWGFEMKDSITVPGWRFHDNTKTTAEVINNLYQTIRKAAGEMYLIGCNTLSHLSAGVFELNRTGDDTSGKEWARTRKMGVNTLAFRLPQHNAFYAVDGDCVGLTSEVPWNKNKQWMQLLAESGAPLFISAQPEAMTVERKSFIKTSFAQAAKVQPVAEPLDWFNSTTPSKWKLNNRIVDFDWD